MEIVGRGCGGVARDAALDYLAIPLGSVNLIGPLILLDFGLICALHTVLVGALFFGALVSD